MTVDEAVETIAAQRLEAVYFLYGEERFFQSEIIGLLVRRLITPENREFNLETFMAGDSAPARWLDAAKTFSFLGGSKLVVVRDLHAATLDEGEVQSLLAYAAAPAAEACLVLTADSADRKKKLYKALCGLKGAVECAAPKEAALIPWLKKRAQAGGYQLGNEAARALTDRLGARPGMLATELVKLMAYAGAAARITEADVAAVVGEVKMENTFALTDALKEKNAEKALRLLHQQLDHGEEPIKILGAIAWQFRAIWEVKHHQAKKIPIPAIAGKMGMSPFVVEKAAKVTGNFSVRQLRRGFDSLAQTDWDLKAGGKNPLAAMENLILDLCSDRR